MKSLYLAISAETNLKKSKDSTYKKMYSQQSFINIDYGDTCTGSKEAKLIQSTNKLETHKIIKIQVKMNNERREKCNCQKIKRN